MNNDILWRVGQELDSPKDVLALATANRDLYELLRGQILIADVESRRNAARDQELDRLYIGTILHWAAIHGDSVLASRAIRAAQLIWPAYLEIRHAVKGFSGPALAHAAKSGHLSVVQELLQAGCHATPFSQSAVDLDRTDDAVALTLARTVPMTLFLFYTTTFELWLQPLCLAIAYGHTSTALFLLKHTGCKLELMDDICMARQALALELACLFGRHSVVTSLLDHDVSPNGTRHDQDGDDAALEAWRTRDLYANVPPLSLATVCGNTDMVDLLLSRGANVDAFNLSGKTSLYWAAKKRSVSNCLRLIEVPGTRAFFWDYEGFTVQAIVADSDSMLPVTKRLAEHKKYVRCMDGAMNAATKAGPAAAETLRFLKELRQDM